jgi:hypothetical protein
MRAWHALTPRRRPVESHNNLHKSVSAGETRAALLDHAHRSVLDAFERST